MNLPRPLATIRTLLAAVLCVAVVAAPVRAGPAPVAANRVVTLAALKQARNVLATKGPEEAGRVAQASCAKKSRPHCVLAAFYAALGQEPERARTLLGGLVAPEKGDSFTPEREALVRRLRERPELLELVPAFSVATGRPEFFVQALNAVSAERPLSENEWLLVRREGCERADRRPAIEAWIAQLPDRAGFVVDTSLFPERNVFESAFGACHLVSRGSRLLLPSGGWGQDRPVVREGGVDRELGVEPVGGHVRLVPSALEERACTDPSLGDVAEALSRRVPGYLALELDVSTIARPERVSATLGRCRFAAESGRLRVVRVGWPGGRIHLEYTWPCEAEPCEVSTLDVPWTSAGSGERAILDAATMSALRPRLVVRRAPAEASVIVDDKPVETARTSGGLVASIPPGASSVRVTAPGRVAWAARELPTGLGERRVVEARLDARSAPTAWRRASLAGAGVGLAAMGAAAGVWRSAELRLGAASVDGVYPAGVLAERAQAERLANTVNVAGLSVLGASLVSLGLALLLPEWTDAFVEPAPEWRDATAEAAP